MSNWKIIVPESTTNYVLNPSAETSGNYAAYSSATVTLDTTQARMGDYAYKVVPGGTSRGVSLTTTALASAIHAVSFYAYGTSGTLAVTCDGGSNWNTAAVVGGSTGGWVRYYASIPAAQANGSTTTTIRNSVNETWYLDCIQAEAKSGYCTTYIDGDQAGGAWLGLRHGSYSWRDGQERSGGRERDLDTDYGVRVLQMPGAGFPPVQQHMQSTALNPGAINLGYKVGARQLVLQLDLHGTTMAILQGRRQDLIDLIRPDAFRGAQPVRLGYAGTSGKTLWADFYYTAGLEMLPIKGGGNWIEGGGNAPVTLIGADPYWYEDNQVTAALSNVSRDVVSAIVANSTNVRRRVAGDYFQWAFPVAAQALWKAPGIGSTLALAYDANSGRVYIGGKFTTVIDSTYSTVITLNRVGYFDGLAYRAMGSGTVGVDDEVYAIAVAPNGDVWVGGKFANCNGAASHGIAKWTPSTDTWTKYALGAGSIFYALEFDTEGNLYAGGNFTNWNGNANSDYIVKYDGTTWSALGTGMNGNVRAITAYSTTVVYVGGEFTTGNSVTLNRVGYWNGTTFVALGTGAGSTVYALAVRSDGTLYIGGDFTTVNGASIVAVACWSSGGWTQLGGGIAGSSLAVYALAFGEGERYLLAGCKGNALQTIDGVSVTTPSLTVCANSLLRFNFYTWSVVDLETGTIGCDVTAIFSKPNDEIWCGTITRVEYHATVTSITVTCAPVDPVFTFRETFASGSRLLLLENQTTRQRQTFSYLQVNGDVLHLSEGNRQMRLVSDRYGEISGQPLAASDSLQLITGTNYLAWYYDDAENIGSTAVLHYTPRHWSIDGPA